MKDNVSVGPLCHQRLGICPPPPPTPAEAKKEL